MCLLICTVVIFILPSNAIIRPFYFYNTLRRMYIYIHMYVVPTPDDLSMRNEIIVSADLSTASIWLRRWFG